MATTPFLPGKPIGRGAWWAPTVTGPKRDYNLVTKQRVNMLFSVTKQGSVIHLK